MFNTYELLVRFRGAYGFTTRESLVFTSDSGKEYKVPKGFETDLASVPRAAWSIIPPMGRYTNAAILHDSLYAERVVSKKEADKVFLEAMRVCGVPAYKRYPMYWAVAAFGGSAYSE